MHRCLHLAILSLLLLAASLRAAEDAQQQHSKRLEKLYPTPAFQILTQVETPHEAYQAAVNAAYRAGVPSSLLNECVATRAMMRADLASLQRLLPALKANLEKYTPETSLFPDKAGAAQIVTIIEKAVEEEQRAPGTLALRAKRASEMGIARKIRSQLTTVDSLVDMRALSKQLTEGTQVTEDQWRAGAPAGTYFTSTGVDELGNPFGPQIVGKPPMVPKASYERLKNFVPDTFWSPFGVPK